MKPTKNDNLANLNYSFDASRNAWNCGKKPVDEEEVLIALIRYAKSQGKRDAGVWAENELSRMKKEPAVTARAFAKRCIIRNRNNRIAGKYLFASWCHAVGIEIVGELADFMVRNSLLVARFYNEVAALFGCYKKQARVLGCVMNSVFFGIELQGDAAELPEQPQKQESHQRHKNEGLRRYQEFMSKNYSPPTHNRLEIAFLTIVLFVLS